LTEQNNNFIAQLKKIIFIVCAGLAVLSCASVNSFAIDYDTHSKRNKYLSFLEQTLPSNYILSLAANPEEEKAIFIGTTKGLCYYNGKRFRTYGSDAGIFKSAPAGDKINCILPASSEVWVAGDSGISRYNKLLSKWSYYEQGDKYNDLPTNYIQCLYFANPFLYIGTWGEGVTIYDTKLRRWKSYASKSGLEAKYISAIAYDSVKNQLWFGSYDNGLYLFQGERFIGFNAKTSELVSDKINCLASASGKLFIGTPLGLCVYDGKNFKTYNKSKGLTTNVVLCLKADKFDIYIGTDDGLFKLYNDTLTHYPISNSLSRGKPVRVTCIETTPSKIYLGTQHHGLIEINK